MTGLSVGFMVVQALSDDIRKVAEAVPARLSGGSRSYPRRERPIYREDAELSGVRYVAVGGHMPFAKPMTHLPDGRVFRFIIEAIGRPVTLIEPHGAQLPIMSRRLALSDSAFRLGGVELQPGIALHFDRRQATESLSSLPQLDRAAVNALPPGYVAIEVDGFSADEIGPAVAHARDMIERDRAFWEAKI